MKHESNQTAEQIKAKAEKEVKDLQTKSTVYELLPDSLEQFDVFVCVTSYSADVVVRVSAKRYPFVECPQITAELINQLSLMFPPIEMRKYTGAFLTFMPVVKWEQQPQRKQDEMKEEQNIAPFIVGIEPANFNNSIKLEWYAQTDLGVINFEFSMPLHTARWLGRSIVTYENYVGGSRCTRNRFEPNNNNIYTLFDEDGTPVAELYPIVHWSAGTSEYPGNKTMYWVPLSESPVKLSALTARMSEKKAGQ